MYIYIYTYIYILYIYIYICFLNNCSRAPRNSLTWPHRRRELASDWPLHDIAITNIVWCTAYKRGVRRAVHIAQ